MYLIDICFQEIGISKMKPKEKSEARKEVTVLSKMRHPQLTCILSG